MGLCWETGPQSQGYYKQLKQAGVEPKLGFSQHVAVAALKSRVLLPELSNCSCWQAAELDQGQLYTAPRSVTPPVDDALARGAPMRTSDLRRREEESVFNMLTSAHSLNTEQS